MRERKGKLVKSYASCQEELQKQALKARKLHKEKMQNRLRVELKAIGIGVGILG